MTTSEIYTYDMDLSAWVPLAPATVVKIKDIVCAKSDIYPGIIFAYGISGAYKIHTGALPDAVLTSGAGTWAEDSPSSTISSFLGDKTLVAGAAAAVNPRLLATLPGSGSNDDVFARFWDTGGLYGTDIVIMRWRSGVGWEEVSGLDVTSGAEYTLMPSYKDYNVIVFRNVGNQLYLGYDYTSNTNIGVIKVWKYTSNAVLTSCWTDTNFPSINTTSGSGGGDSGFVRIWGLDMTQGASSAIYVPVTYNTSGNIQFEEMQYSAGTSGTTSSFIIIGASSGDIYNIGGLSGEPTTNIIFTLWDNQSYGRGGRR